MSTTSIGDGAPEAQSVRSAAVTHRGRGISMRVLMLLVVCAGATVWAGRNVWESSHPMLSAVRELRSADSSERAASVRTLSELGSTSGGAVIRAALPVLADPSAGVREAGAETLGIVGSYTAGSASETESTRAAVAALTELLKDREPSVRGKAAGALGVVAGVAAGSNRGGRRRGGQTAKAPAPPRADIDSMAIVNSLLDLLSDRDSDVRQAVLSGLRDCAPRVVNEPPSRLFAAIDDESASNRAVAVGVLVSFSKGLDPVMPVLLRHLAQDEPQVRDACRAALARIPASGMTSAVIPALIEGLGSEDRDARLHLVGILARMSPDPRVAVPALIKVLREPADSDQTVLSPTSATSHYEGPAQEAAKALGGIAPGTSAAGEAIAALTETVPRARRSVGPPRPTRWASSARRPPGPSPRWWPSSKAAWPAIRPPSTEPRPPRPSAGSHRVPHRRPRRWPP